MQIHILITIEVIIYRNYFTHSKNLTLIATNFRSAIEKAQMNNEPGYYFERFPVAQCGTTSNLLAQYLLDSGFTKVIYVNRSHSSSKLIMPIPHTWLLVENNIIDITADQFKKYDNELYNNIPVYVGPMNDFYRLFKPDNGSFHEHYGLDKNWSNYYELKDAYRIISKYL